MLTRCGGEAHAIPSPQPEPPPLAAPHDRPEGLPLLFPRLAGPRGLGAELAEDLRAGGVEATLDQWDLCPGADLAPSWRRASAPPLGTNPFGAGQGSRGSAEQGPQASVPGRPRSSDTSKAPQSPPEETPFSPWPVHPIRATSCLILREGNRWRHQRTTVEVQGYEEELAPGVVITMLRIPGATFLMGSPEAEEGRDNDAGPQHEVNVRELFLAQTPITQAQWQVVMDCRVKRSGNRPAGRARQHRSIPGTRSPRNWPTLTPAPPMAVAPRGRTGSRPRLWARSRPTPGAFTTCTATCGSGARTTSMTPTTSPPMTDCPG